MESLENVANCQYAKLRKQFLKEAKKHFSKEVWKEGYFKALASTGAAIGTGGAVLYVAYDSPLCIVPAGVGLINMIQAYARKQFVTNALVETLDKRTANASYLELDKRVKDSDYTVPDPTEDELKEAAIDVYALRVMDAVAEKDFGFGKYPWSAVGIGLAAYGMFKAADNPIAGGFTLSIGSLFFIGANLVKRKKIADVAKKASSFLKNRGYDYFDSYVKRKDPYEFYETKLKSAVI